MKSQELPKQRQASRLFLTLIMGGILLTLPFLGSAAGEESDVWVQTGRLVQPSEDPVKFSFCPVWVDLICGNARLTFGAAIAIDGDTVVVGEPDKNRVHIYERIGLWHETAVLEGGEGFGSAVAIEGDVLVVGAPGASAGIIWVRSGDGWTQDAAIETDGCLGRSASVDQERVVFGDSCEGRIHVVERPEEDWTTTAVLEFQGDDVMGSRLDSSGDRIISNVRGGVVVFELTNEGWEGVQVHSTNSRSVGISGDTIAIGELDIMNFKVTVYEWDGQGWFNVAELKNQDASPFQIWEYFGQSLAIQGDRLIVGSPEDDVSPGDFHLDPDEDEACISEFGYKVCALPRPGAVYIFERGEDGWTQQDKIVADHVGDGRFGRAVALDPGGNDFAAGATFKTSNVFGTPPTVNLENSVHLYSRVSGMV